LLTKSLLNIILIQNHKDYNINNNENEINRLCGDALSQLESVWSKLDYVTKVECYSFNPNEPKFINAYNILNENLAEIKT
jgi:hypothetical protein